MKIVTYGNKEKEKILLLHPMFTSAKFFNFVIDRLSNKYKGKHKIAKDAINSIK